MFNLLHISERETKGKSGRINILLRKQSVQVIKMIIKYGAKEKGPRAVQKNKEANQLCKQLNRNYKNSKIPYR